MDAANLHSANPTHSPRRKDPCRVMFVSLCESDQPSSPAITTTSEAVVEVAPASGYLMLVASQSRFRDGAELTRPMMTTTIVNSVSVKPLRAR